MEIWFGMAESLSEIFERMLSKKQVMVDRYQALKNRLAAADERVSELERENARQRQTLEKLEMENEYLRIARKIAPDRDALDRSRTLIAKLVRDVDKCIEQLNDWKVSLKHIERHKAEIYYIAT